MPSVIHSGTAHVHFVDKLVYGRFQCSVVWQHLDVRTNPHIFFVIRNRLFAMRRLLGVTHRYFSACFKIKPSSAEMRLMLNGEPIHTAVSNCSVRDVGIRQWQFIRNSRRTPAKPLGSQLS